MQLAEIAAWRDLREQRGFSEALRNGEHWAICELSQSHAYYSTLIDALRKRNSPMF